MSCTYQPEKIGPKPGGMARYFVILVITKEVDNQMRRVIKKHVDIVPQHVIYSTQ